MLADLLLQTSLIIWDEAPMQHRYCAEAVERTLQDIRNCDNQPFGGIPIVFGGDFRQILPVIIKGSRSEIVASCLRKSPIWNYVTVLTLKQNMRLQVSSEDTAYAQFLQEVGNGMHTTPDGQITLPTAMRCHNGIAGLIASIYQNIDMHSLAQNWNNLGNYFLERTILCARNDKVEVVNQAVLDLFQGEEFSYFGVDKVIEEAGASNTPTTLYPTEFLNSISHSGLPPAILKVKKGVPLMVLRNLDPQNGVCNGTRCILISSTRRVLKVQLIGGEYHGKVVLIPRIKLSPPEGDIGFHLQRLQFPVRLAFAMTINKSQGQSVNYVGIDLTTPVFTHGQLYVALSRCRTLHNIKILLPDTGEGQQQEAVTKNIVFTEALIV